MKYVGEKPRYDFIKASFTSAKVQILLQNRPGNEIWLGLWLDRSRAKDGHGSHPQVFLSVDCKASFPPLALSKDSRKSASPSTFSFPMTLANWNLRLRSSLVTCSSWPWKGITSRTTKNTWVAHPIVYELRFFERCLICSTVLNYFVLISAPNVRLRVFRRAREQDTFSRHIPDLGGIHRTVIC